MSEQNRYEEQQSLGEISHSHSRTGALFSVGFVSS
jgi:hypothetical protein